MLMEKFLKHFLFIFNKKGDHNLQKQVTADLKSAPFILTISPEFTSAKQSCKNIKVEGRLEGSGAAIALYTCHISPQNIQF